MPFDAVCLAGMVAELKKSVVGQRIEKIQQPARDQVVLTMRGNKKLLLNAGANQPRIQLTSLLRENPAAPPMFCMLLRKHLGGGIVTEIVQPSLERVVILSILAKDELGVAGERKLVLECMGRHSNLILVGSDGRIVDCMRRVDFEMSEQRQVLPGLFYHLPPPQEKRNPLEVDEDTFLSLLQQSNPDKTIDQFLLDTFFGLSPLVCRELTISALGELDRTAGSLSNTAKQQVADVFLSWQNTVKEFHFTPTMIMRNHRPSDFSYLDISQYGSSVELTIFESFSQMLDVYYETREQQERVQQRGQELLRAATAARDRIARKLLIQEKERKETENRETLRIKGELITANLYRMEKGSRVLEAENYYEENCPILSIALDPLLTPQQNAAKYFKKYNKAKTAQKVLTEQIQKGQEEHTYLCSILDELSRAELEQDFLDIRQELMAAGFLKQQKNGKKELKRSTSKPRVFHSSSGLTILVGRNNTQNDRLTKEADKRDIWFHTQKIHGSHVILCTEGTTPDNQSLTEAAILAAYFSQGRENDRVAVDYTQVRNVKKPSGARPGMVVYDPYETAFVKPDEAIVKALAR